jgi:hypothetical protein
MQAHDVLEHLQGRLADDGLEAARAEIARVARESGWTIGPGHEAFDEVIAEITRERSMRGDLRRVWHMLLRRVTEPTVKKHLDDLDRRMALGSLTDGELSAAVFAYPDRSYLILVDHGLMLCTWLVAQLGSCLVRSSGHPQEGPAVAVDDALAAIRLTIARPAVGARAGLLPPLILSDARFRTAAALAAEMDLFLMAQEAAHILLGHFSAGRRALGALSGPAVTSDDARPLEHEADLLALALALDDIIQGDAEPELAPLRVAGVRLALGLIELYERTCFVLQPTSPPPAAERFAALRERALKPWFGADLDAVLAPLAPLAEGLIAPAMEDLPHAIGRVDRGLDGVLDRHLWRASDWADVAQLGALVAPRPARARQAIGASFPETTEGNHALAAFLGDLAAAPATQQAIAASHAGEPLTRLAFVDLAAALLTERGREDLPVWAVAGLLTSTIRRFVEAGSGTMNADDVLQ